MDFFMTYVYRVLCGLPEPHSREMQAMTDERVRVCLNYKMSSPILMHLHKSLTVKQLNSIPLIQVLFDRKTVDERFWCNFLMTCTCAWTCAL